MRYMVECGSIYMNYMTEGAVDEVCDQSSLYG